GQGGTAPSGTFAAAPAVPARATRGAAGSHSRPPEGGGQIGSWTDRHQGGPRAVAGQEDCAGQDRPNAKTEVAAFAVPARAPRQARVRDDVPDALVSRGPSSAVAGSLSIPHASRRACRPRATGPRRHPGD